MDSFAHLSSVLNTLINLLPDEKKIMLRSITEELSLKKYMDMTQKIEGSEPGSLQYLAHNLLYFKLIVKKGLYPYELIDDISKLDLPIETLKKELQTLKQLTAIAA